MSDHFLFAVSLSLIFGALFIIVDYFEHKHHHIHISFIAGVSIAYFFLVVLPEVSEGMPEYPLHLKMLEYLFILIGFCFTHLSEKVILQKVEVKSQKRMRKLLTMESDLEEVEDNIEIFIVNELKNETLDIDALNQLGQTFVSLYKQSNKIKSEINQYKKKIQTHINRDLSELRFFTNYIYHLLIGIILVGLLVINLIPGILFFVFAWFRAIISNRSENHLLFTDLDISTEFKQTPLKKALSATATIIGVIIGLITEFILPISLELEFIYLLYSFVTGVIFYTIVREVLPEKEKGKPLYFLLGLICFGIFIFLMRFLEIFSL